MTHTTADLADAYPDAAIARPGFADFGGRAQFSGPIRTVRCWEDNSKVRAALDTPGYGAVLVVDGGGSMSCALLGDRLGAMAASNGWMGVIINGCVRDAAELARLDLGVRALGTMPRRSDKRDTGETDLPVTFAGVTFTPGEWVYVDEDGIVVLPVQAV